jgi:Zn-dependent M28 family amino/carboxypeptidase
MERATMTTRNRTRHRGGRRAAWLLFASLSVLLGGMIIIGINMPGHSYRGALPPLSPAQAELRNRLHRHIDTLAGTIGERNLHHYSALQAAARYITDAFTEFGYQPVAHPYHVGSYLVQNIEAVKPGSPETDEIIVIGAHYDSVRGSPGANDNASGVAALLELARWLHAQPVAREVRFVAFVNEEPPYFYSDAMGSWRYARQAAARGDRIQAMLSLETIGYYSSEANSQRYPFPFRLFYPAHGNFIGFVGNLRSRALVRQAIASFRASAEFPSEGVAAPGGLTGIGWSDHWSFWQVGYRAIMVTDTALFRYAPYHTPGDRPDRVDTESLARVVDGLRAVVLDLANAA